MAKRNSDPMNCTTPIVMLAAGALALFVSACTPEAPDAADPVLAAEPESCLPPARADAIEISGRLARIPGGFAELGSEDFGSEERPLRRVSVESFEMDVTEVTNRAFAAFVEATGYVTVAERIGGGAVFTQPSSPPDMRDPTSWWRIDPDATWSSPGGRGTVASPDKPVVQVTLEDAIAYARWAGRDIPTEAEWEHAARGGIIGAKYTWGDEPEKSASAANHWQGTFPLRDRGEDGFAGIAPVGCFPANGYGLHDMAGNVWELTASAWGRPGAAAGASVIKGGSWLCADNYCLRYRPAARQPGDPELPTNHIGFRTIQR
jgi:formylglycine-generating enzyme